MFFFRVVIRSCSKISSCASLSFPRRLGAKSETAEESIAVDGPSRGFGFVQHAFGKKKRDTRKAVSNVSKKRAPDKATSSHHRGSGTIAASVSSRLALAPLSGLRRVASRVSARVAVRRCPTRSASVSATAALASDPDPTPPMSTRSVLWFRKGLRVHDNPALQRACEGASAGGHLHATGPHRAGAERVAGLGSPAVCLVQALAPAQGHEAVEHSPRTAEREHIVMIR